MAKSRDIKIIGEIKSKIKVIETEEETEKAEETTEEPLEDLVMDAPSAREFPEFGMLGGQGSQEMEQRAEAQTPSAATTDENKNAVRYQIQKDVTEEEIARTYRTDVSEARPIMLGMTNQDRTSGERLSNRELESARNKDEGVKYKLSAEPEKQEKKRKYPWES